MRFNFALGKNAEAGDHVDDLRDRLEVLGHEFSVSRGLLPPPWINLFCESVEEVTPERAYQAHRNGWRMICLATEAPTLVTDEGLVWNYRTEDDWTARAERFVESAPYFSAVWCYAPGAAAVIKRFCPVTTDIDMGWGKRFLSSRRTIRPTHDFCFFGVLTRRRARIIDELRAGGNSVDIIPHETSLAARDMRIQNSCVVLDLKQFHWWSLVSSMRYVTALLAGRPVVAEARSSEAKGDWAKVVRFADTSAPFVEIAKIVLADWQVEKERQLKSLYEKPDHLIDAIQSLPPFGGWIEERTHNSGSTTARYLPRMPAPFLVEMIGAFNLVSWDGAVFAIPQSVGPIDLDKANLSLACFATIKRFADVDEARKALRR